MAAGTGWKWWSSKSLNDATAAQGLQQDVAAAHAGWRGLAGEGGVGVLESAMRSVFEQNTALALNQQAQEAIKMIVTCSKGTYIRSLARDIARALGTVGHVTYLRRTKAGPFAEATAISLDLLNEIGKGARLEDHLLPLEAGLDGIPAHPLDPESAQAARQGRVVSGHALPDGLFLGTAGGIPVALMESDGVAAKVVRGFNLPDTAKKDET